MVLTGGRLLHVGDGQDSSGSVLNQRACVIPLITDRLGAFRIHAQFRGLPKRCGGVFRLQNDLGGLGRRGRDHHDRDRLGLELLRGVAHLHRVIPGVSRLEVGERHGRPGGARDGFAILRPLVTERWRALRSDDQIDGSPLQRPLPIPLSIQLGFGQVRDGQGDQHDQGGCGARLLASPRQAFIGHHNMIAARILARQVCQRQGAARGLLDECAPVIPFIRDRLGADDDHFKCKGAAHIHAAANRLRHDSYCRDADCNDRLPHKPVVKADRQFVVPGGIGIETVQAQRRAGCTLDRRLAQAPLVGQLGHAGRRDGQLDRLPFVHGNRPGQLRYRRGWLHGKGRGFAGVRAQPVGGHDMIISRRLNPRLGQAQSVARYSIN